MAWPDDPDGVYHRVILNRANTEFVTAEVQWFDEYDYDQKRFLTEEKFATEDEAQLLCDKANLGVYQMGLIPMLQTLSVPFIKSLLAEAGKI